MDSKLHPAITVTNIRNFIPFTLEMESGQYNSWAELFRIHCRAFQVSDHIDSTIPAPKPKAAAADNATPTPDPAVELWSRLDAIVLQWIYSTISNDLLHTILKPNSKASQAWVALENIFQDNQSSRAVYLEHKFVTTRLDNYPNISSYCQALKMSDQLANVSSPVTNQRLVLQLIAGLNENYEGVAMMLQQTSPLPEFYEARSKLILEETRKSHQSSSTGNSTGGTALHTTTQQHQQTSSSRYSGQGTSNQFSDNPQSGTTRGGRGRGRGGRGRGRSGTGRGRGASGGQQPQYTNYSPRPDATWAIAPPWTFSPTWAYPPCPYPTQPNQSYGSQRQAQSPNPTGPGILGPRPTHQVYAASESSYAPTDIEQAFHSMSLNPPDQNWYMDTGATSHMTHSSGLPNADTHPQM